MSDLLFAKSLQWTCWDPSNLLTAMLHNLLSEWGHARSIRTQLTRAVKLSEIELLLAVRRIDLAAWGLWESEQYPAVCASLAVAAKLQNPPLRLCFVAPELGEHVGLLTEAGGQVVTCQLHRLQSLLPRILGACRLSHQGSHPLTSGLVDRLPWGHVAPADPEADVVRPW